MKLSFALAWLVILSSIGILLNNGDYGMAATLAVLWLCSLLLAIVMDA